VDFADALGIELSARLVEHLLVGHYVVEAELQQKVAKVVALGATCSVINANRHHSVRVGRTEHESLVEVLLLLIHNNYKKYKGTITEMQSKSRPTSPADYQVASTLKSKTTNGENSIELFDQ
jgi:hypothetical protein